ncbi:PDZ domain (Also known as DHR or GLGF) [Stieleria neptunia]|uniref:PDZ domain (Also known as DHR or GLGF) n=1 Tax=Stieleria neptunia TaxID=2527979 RepID=A0A518HSC4_9BACT|nr:PDZ domain-containing protein [Stieleria neptunia]QDV43736.1 PDZ domain (Also known as DHR or GLGF) [Stieleria neptunia]
MNVLRWGVFGLSVLVASSAALADGDPVSASKANPKAMPDGGGFVEPKPGQGSGNPVLGGWYLGVYGSYSATGLLLTQVYPGTAAARVGLEVGDRIITVNGHQIGIGPHSNLRIDTALQRYASRSGWVRLLVKDKRTGRLINVDVKLTRGAVHF